MRKVARLLLIGCATLALSQMGMAAETWKWRDANGVVHYSDQPAPGAERVNVLPPTPSISVTRPAAAPRAAAADGDEEDDQTSAFRYSRCVVTAPGSEETFNAINTVSAGLLIEPALQPGHRIEVLLNGSIVKGWPQNAMSYTLTGLDRGSYTLGVRVLDSSGGTVCSGPIINFHVRLPTVPQLRVNPLPAPRPPVVTPRG